jgi:hypothetical protein
MNHVYCPFLSRDKKIGSTGIEPVTKKLMGTVGFEPTRGFLPENYELKNISVKKYTKHNLRTNIIYDNM